MTADAVLPSEPSADRQHYEIELPIRGCEFSLPDIKAAYRDLQKITMQEGAATLAGLQKPEGKDQAEFDADLEHYRRDAFKLTLSIVGENGLTYYAENEDAFDNKNLPNPIASVYFTNINSFRRNANGNMPRHRFELLLDFRKRPLIDIDSILSNPTPNESKVSVSSDDLRYFSSIKSIVSDEFLTKQKWYSFIHKKLFYDVALFLFALPYSFFVVVANLDLFFKNYQQWEPFRLPAFIYFTYVCLLMFRALIGYAKWAYPVNTLIENKDTPALHRAVIGGLLVGLVVWVVRLATTFAISPIIGK